MTVESLSEPRIRKALCRMFAGHPDKRDWEFRLDVYTQALSAVPVTFAEEACDYVIKGKLHGGRFLPNAGELVQLAEELRARTLRHHGRPRFSWEHSDLTVHNTEEQRRAIIAGFRQLLTGIRTGRPINPQRAVREVFKED